MARSMNSTARDARDAEHLRLWRSGMSYRDVAAYYGVGVFAAMECVLRAMWRESRSAGPPPLRDDG